MTIRCVGCGAEVQAIDGPIHRYVTSAPACWQRYGELLAVHYTRPELATSLIMCTDTYAAQHPGTPSPQAIQSVAVHLLNLYRYVERGDPAGIPHGTAASRGAKWLEPPTFANALTVFDVPLSGESAAIAAAARSWAESVWAAWSVHHDQVAKWHAQSG